MEILATGPILIAFSNGVTVTVGREELEELVDKAIDILEPGEVEIDDEECEECEECEESFDECVEDIIAKAIMKAIGGDSE